VAREISWTEFILTLHDALAREHAGLLQAASGARGDRSLAYIELAARLEQDTFDQVSELVSLATTAGCPAGPHPGDPATK
jgi:hypothetical protein